jgi:ABC-type glycerol-3-phosphate transport system substrate-binding protein
MTLLSFNLFKEQPMTQKQLIDIYLDYRNNFLSFDGYASYYGLPYDLASSLIIYSRELYNLTYP